MVTDMVVTDLVKAFWDEQMYGEILAEDTGGGLRLWVQAVYLPTIEEKVYGIFASDGSYYDFYSNSNEALEIMFREASNRFACFHC